MKFKKSLFIIVLLFLAGCATVSTMKVPVTKPAEINLVGIKTIAIGEIAGRNSQDFSDELTTRLFQSGRYEVLDRQHFSRILEEHKLTFSGLVDESSAAEIGKLLGSAALVFGRISNHAYNEEQTYKDMVDQKGKSSRMYKRNGIANVTITLQITDLRTGKIIAIRNFSEKSEKEEIEFDKEADKIDSEKLLRDTRSKILDKFMKDIAPYTVTAKVTFLPDKKVPQLDQGIAMAKIGNWNKAIEYFKSATEAAPTNSKAFYNLGVAYEYSYNFPQAIFALEKAYELEQKNEYIKELSRCRQMQADREKLQLQMDSIKK